MATAPDQDVVDKLETALSIVEGTTIFKGPVRAVDDYIPDAAIFVLPAGGPPPVALTGNGTDYVTSFVQIRIRSAPQDYAGGLTRARAVRDAIHKAAITGYVDIRVREAEPLYLAQDQEGRHEWSVNVALEHRR